MLGVLIFKLIFPNQQCTINIVFDRHGKMDPITRTLQFSVDYIGLDVDIKFWSQQISFLVIGIIVLTSIRGLLINLTKVRPYDLTESFTIFFQFFYAFSSSKSSNIIVLALAELMGMYFVSSILLMRMNMPLEYRVIITDVLGDLQFKFYHRWFDVIFLISALVSIVFIYVSRQGMNKEL